MTGVDITELSPHTSCGPDGEAARRALASWIEQQWAIAERAVAEHRGPAADFAIPHLPPAIPAP